jgi:RNA-binding protein 25
MTLLVLFSFDAGVARIPIQFAGMMRPGFAPRPIPLVARTPIPGIRPGPTPPIVTPALRPIAPIPLVEKPQTTVYVGKIASTVDNDFLLQLLKVRLICSLFGGW